MLLAVVVIGQPALAAEWDVEPAVSVAATYTDNLRLRAPDESVDELVTEVSPSISLTATGDRLKTEFSYRLQALRYSDREDFDEVLDYSALNGTANLIGKNLLLDFSGSISQQTIDASQRNAISGISQADNRSEVGVYSISPRFWRQIGNTSSLSVGVRFGGVEYDDPVLTDSESTGIFATVSGAPPSTPLSWRLNFNKSDIDYDTGSNVQLQRAGGEFAWAFNRSLSVVASIGDENNTFAQLFGPRKIDGSYWSIGGRGQLGRLTSYSFSAGEQHFGDSYGFSLQRTAGKLTTDISYAEETTTRGAQQLQYEALFQFLTEITGVELPTPGAEVYVRKRLSAVAALKLAQSNIKLNAYNEDRDYLTSTSSESDSVFGVALSYSWNARAKTKVTFDAGWQQIESINSLEQPEDVRLQLRIRQDLTDTISMSLRAWQNSRFATTADKEYEVNAVSLGISKVF